MSKALGESIMGARLFATMPNQKQNNPEPSLDQQIDQLVAGMTEATADLERQIEEANLPDEAFEAAASIKAVDQPEANEVETTAAPESVETEVSEEAEIDEPEDEPEAVEVETASLDVQVDAMLDDAAASVEAATESRSTVDAVDEELSELADEMLDGDFDDADTVLAAGIEAPTQAAPGLDDQTDAETESEPAAHEAEAIDEDDLLDGDFDDADEVIAQGVPEAPQAKVEAVPAAETQTPEPEPEPEPVAAAPKPEPKPEPAPEAKTEPKAKAPKPAPSAEINDEAESETETEPSAKKTERKVRHKKPTKPRKGSLKRNTEGQPRWRVIAEDARERTGEAAYIVAEKLTKPLDSRPEMLKGLTGWLAAVTLFNAIAVWVFMLVVRGPTVGTSAQPAVDLAGQQTNAVTHNEEID